MHPMQGQSTDERVERGERARIALQAPLVKMLLEIAGGRATKGGRGRSGAGSGRCPMTFARHELDDDSAPVGVGRRDWLVSGEKCAEVHGAGAVLSHLPAREREFSTALAEAPQLSRSAPTIVGIAYDPFKLSNEDARSRIQTR